MLKAHYHMVDLSFYEISNNKTLKQLLQVAVRENLFLLLALQIV